MRKLSIILIHLLFVNANLYSYFGNFFIQSALQETNFNSPMNPNYEFSLLDNPKYYLSTYYLPSKFELNELSTIGILAAIPIFDKMILSINGNGYGEKKFRKSSLGINLAKDFDSQFLLKVGISLDNFVIYKYDSYNKIMIDFGAKLPIFSFFNIGISFENINRAYYEIDDFIQQSGILSFGFKITDNFNLDFNNYLNFGQNYSYGFIASYELMNLIKTRVAFANKPLKYDLGLQIKIYNFAFMGLDYCYNRNLGYVSYYFLTIIL